jgi:hypothetical protein
LDPDEIGSLFLAMAAILGLLALMIAIRVATRPVTVIVERSEFMPVPKTTPSVYSLEVDD